MNLYINSYFKSTITYNIVSGSYLNNNSIIINLGEQQEEGEQEQQ